MRLKSALVEELIEIVTSSVAPYQYPYEKTFLHVYRLNGIIVTMYDEGNLFGLNFEVLGKDFTITADFSVMYTDLDDGELYSELVEMPVVFCVQDEATISILEAFIKWRISALKEIGL